MMKETKHPYIAELVQQLMEALYFLVIQMLFLLKVKNGILTLLNLQIKVMENSTEEGLVI